MIKTFIRPDGIELKNRHGCKRMFQIKDTGGIINPLSLDRKRSTETGLK